jgi:hypothetical protein
MTKKQTTIDSVPSLPDWINATTWTAYLAQRKTKRAANTDYALGLVLRDLDKMRLAGHDPNSVLDKSCRKGWTDVYWPTPEAAVAPRQQSFAEREREAAADRMNEWSGGRAGAKVQSLFPTPLAQRIK